MYIVDAEKPAGGMDVPPPPPPHPDYPSPPPNAIPFMNNGTPIPIYYNQTVVLQCLTSGVVSPVLIIRKVDHQTTVVGGGAQEGSKGVGEQFCAPGEVCGDPVSQLHKVAFEVFEPGKGAPEPGTLGSTGAFLSCMGEKVNTYRPVDGRQWQSGSMARAVPILQWYLARPSSRPLHRMVLATTTSHRGHHQQSAASLHPPFRTPWSSLQTTGDESRKGSVGHRARAARVVLRPRLDDAHLLLALLAVGRLVVTRALPRVLCGK
jgi:hypothetical protein